MFTRYRGESEARGRMEVGMCQCYEWQRANDGGRRSLSYNRCGRGMKGTGGGDEAGGLGVGKCVSVCLCVHVMTGCDLSSDLPTTATAV